MNNFNFSSDFPDFIDEKTLMEASLPPQQTHPHQFSEILPMVNKANSHHSTAPNKKKVRQENSPNKNQQNKNIDQQSHKQNNQNQENSKINLDPSKIVNNASHSPQHSQRQKQQHQKQNQQQQQQQHQNQNQNSQQQHQNSQQQHQNSQQQHQNSQQQHQNSQQQHQNSQQQHQNFQQRQRQRQNKQNKFLYTPDQNNDNNNSSTTSNENRSPKKNKDKNNSNNNTNNSNNISSDNKSEQTIEAMTVSHPLIFYSFNCYLSATFNSETQTLYTYDKSSTNFNQNQLNQKEPVTSFVLLDEGTYVYSTSQGVFVSSRIDGETFHPLPNITDIRPDNTNDKCHFFVLADGNLYICQYLNKKIQPFLLHKNVIDFDFSRLYRLIIKKKGYRLYKRNDFKSFPLVKYNFKAPTSSKYFCDDDNVYEFSDGQVIPYLINQNHLKLCESIQNVVNVFSSDEVAIIINDNNNPNNNNNLSTIPRSLYKIQIKEQMYDLKKLPTCVIINDGVISIWSDFDFPPTWLKIPDLQEGQKYYDVNFIKETAKDSISLIKELNATYNDYLKRLNGLIEKAISSINISFGKLKDQFKTLNSKVEKIEEIAMNTAATPQMCINLYKKDVDRAFRAAAHYSVGNLIALCNENRFFESLQNNKISDETLIEIAEVFTDNLEQMGYSIVPYFVDLLIYFDPENEIFKARIKPLTSTILSATIALFPTVETSDPNYMNLRRLAHIAMSLQNT